MALATSGQMAVCEAPPDTMISPTCDALPAWVRGLDYDLRIDMQMMIIDSHSLPEKHKTEKMREPP